MERQRIDFIEDLPIPGKSSATAEWQRFRADLDAALMHARTNGLDQLAVYNTIVFAWRRVFRGEMA